MKKKTEENPKSDTQTHIYTQSYDTKLPKNGFSSVFASVFFYFFLSFFPLIKHQTHCVQFVFAIAFS